MFDCFSLVEQFVLSLIDKFLVVFVDGEVLHN